MSLPLLDTIFLTRRDSVSAERRATYRTIVWVVVLLHIVLVAAVLVATLVRNKTHSPDPGAYFFTLLQSVSVISGLLLVFLSLKSETLITQTHDFALAATQAASLEFDSFQEHVLWLKENLSPQRFPNADHIVMTYSTPVYGVGARDASTTAFLDYFESWVTHFEQNAERAARPPRWDLSVWNKEDNSRTFGSPTFNWNEPANSAAFHRMSGLLARIYCLHKDHKVDFNLHFTDPSHARVFLASDHSRTFGGMVTLFSPLTPSAVAHHGWGLIGFSIREEQAHSNIARFNLRLQKRDHASARPENNVNVLVSPCDWLAEHYGIQRPQVPTVTN